MKSKNLKFFKIACLSVSFTVFFVVFLSVNLNAQIRRAGQLNKKKAGTVSLRPTISTGSKGPDICPTGIAGFDGARCGNCVKELEASRDQNTEIIQRTSGSMINPITIKTNPSNVYYLCQTYKKWPSCFDTFVAATCDGKAMPSCDNDPTSPAAPGDFCTKCQTDASAIKNWWEKPNWWFNSKIYANGKTCGADTNASGECEITAGIDLSVLGMSAADQTAFFNDIKPTSFVPADPANAETEFYAKKDWTVEQLKAIKDNIEAKLKALKQDYNTALQKARSNDLENAKANAEYAARKAEVDKQYGLAIATGVTGALAGVGGVASAVTAGIVHDKAKKVNAGASDIYVRTNELKNSTIGIYNTAVAEPATEGE